MKTLYLECAMGAAGDMLTAALYELLDGPQREKFLRDMNSLLPGLSVEAEKTARRGVAGTHIRVTWQGREEESGHEHSHGSHHIHRSLKDVQAVIESLPLPAEVRADASAVYGRIARAESAAHGVPVGEVHFHEVGAMDAVADVTAVCSLMRALAPDRVTASPVSLGGGTVRTAHGVLPVPAPATVRLLEGIPAYGGGVESELCTPTGAALIAHFAQDFGPLPAGRILGCGVGCGTRDLPRANCLRAFLMEDGSAGGANDAVTELKANIDDMTGEALGFAMERLLTAGALDVSFAPVYMKKGRPGVLLTCLCRPADADALARELLRHTSTFGVRRTDCARYALTPTVKDGVKTGTGYGVVKSKREYEPLAARARERNVPLSDAE